jgi:hypothetical protein
MNDGYREVIAAGAEERRNLFLAAASRLGTPVQNVEKDFWVCWTLDVLFHGLGQDVPRLLFKGGTSLSKAFTHSSRVSLRTSTSRCSDPISGRRLRSQSSRR